MKYLLNKPENVRGGHDGLSGPGLSGDGAKIESPDLNVGHNPATACKGSGERILVVEDELFLRKSVSFVLSKNGYAVFEAASAGEAVEVVHREKGRFDLLFIDVLLGDRSGVVLVDELLAHHDFNVLFTSGYLDIDARCPMIKKNGFLMLQKPFEVIDLLDFVRRSIKGKQA